METKYCLECRNPFIQKFKSNNRKFCSPSCATIFANKKRKGIKDLHFTCKTCGKSISMNVCAFNKLKQRGLGKNIFCSKKCSGIFKRGEIRPQTTKSLIKYYELNGCNRHHNGNGNGGFRNDLNIYVRSCWEANIARLLKFNNINYEFEKESFKMNIDNKITTYTPDFYLKDFNMWIEVKGYWYNMLSKQKYENFKETHKIILIDKDIYKMLSYKYSKIIPNWEIVKGHSY